MSSHKYSHFNTNTTPTIFFFQETNRSYKLNQTIGLKTRRQIYAKFLLSLLREFLIESTQCCRQDSIHYFQEDMGNGLVSPIYRHHLTSIHFNRILFSKTKGDPNHLTQKRMMQLHLRCLPHKSRHKLVVQLRHMLLVQVFF